MLFRLLEAASVLTAELTDFALALPLAFAFAFCLGALLAAVLAAALPLALAPSGPSPPRLDDFLLCDLEELELLLLLDESSEFTVPWEGPHLCILLIVDMLCDARSGSGIVRIRLLFIVALVGFLAS